MAEKLKIIPLGGLNEIGKNMTAYEYGGEIIVVDCGMAFPGDDMYGIDCVIPDVSYLVKNRSRLRGLFITHGHEDHIGAIPYVLKQINLPIYCTKFTAGLIKLKLQEHGLVGSTKLITVEPGQTVRAGKFQVEFIHVNHSIADSVAFAIHTRMGTVVHTGDFKIDSTPIDGEVIDLARFGELGKQGVLALLADSTNVERPGYTMSERAVGATFKRQFTGCDKRIIVTTFASNVHRIQQVLDAAAACGRKVAVTGRSMENIMKVSTELGYMKVPKNTLMDINRIKGLPLSQQVIVTTGSQGEEMSALYRMAFSTHKQVDIGAGDKVIISASAIPGNEVTVGRVINELFRKGVKVVYDRADMLHVSGHACQEEEKMMLGLVKPKYFIPVHGEYRMLWQHGELAESMGMNNVAELKTFVSNSLLFNQEANELYGQLYDAAEVNTDTLPEDVQQYFTNTVLYQPYLYAQMRGVSLETMLSQAGYSSVDEYLENSESSKQSMIKQILIMQALAEKNNIVCDTDILNAEFSRYFGSTDMTSYVNAYGENYVKTNILHDIVMQNQIDNVA